MTTLFTKPVTQKIWTPSQRKIITNLNEFQTAEELFYRQTLKRLGVMEEKGFTQRMNNASRLAKQLRQPR